MDVGGWLRGLGLGQFARNIPLGCGVGVMGWRMEECDAPSVPDPLTAARRRRSSCRHFPPNVRCSPDCGLWRQDQAELSGGQWARTDLCTPDPETGLLEGPMRFQRHVSRPRALAYRWNRPRTSPNICHGRPDQRPGTRLLRALARSSTSA